MVICFSGEGGFAGGFGLDVLRCLGDSIVFRGIIGFSVLRSVFTGRGDGIWCARCLARVYIVVRVFCFYISFFGCRVLRIRCDVEFRFGDLVCL